MTAPGTALRADPRLRRGRMLSLLWLSSTVFSSVVMPGIGVLRETRPLWVVLGTIGILAFAVAQAGTLYGTVSMPDREAAPRGWRVAFAVTAGASTVLVGPVAGGTWQTWAWVGASVIGTLPLLMRPARAAVGGIAVCAVGLTVAVATGGSPAQSLLIIVTVGAGLALLNVSPVLLWNLVADAHAGRAAVAELAVNEERLRFAREVHDLLGHSLSVIALKAELIERRVAAGRVEEEAAAIRRLAATALSDVRAVVAGSRRVDLVAELQALSEVLRSSGVDCRLQVDPLASGRADAVLAPVAREAVTNVLRHSRASRCTISLARAGEGVRLAIRNDGANGSPGRDPASGGLQGARDRLRDVGGRLDIERGGDMFEVRATIGVAP